MRKTLPTFVKHTHVSRKIRVKLGDRASSTQLKMRRTPLCSNLERYEFPYTTLTDHITRILIFLLSGTDPRPISTEEKPRPVVRAPVKEEGAHSNSENDAIDKVEEVMVVPLVPETFPPLFFMFQWVETLTTRQRVSVVINMPSGTLNTYEICVVSGEFVLKFLVAFP